MVYIYAPHINNRLAYVSEVLFKEILGLPYKLIDNIENYEINHPLINYSGKKLDGVCYQIHPSGLIYEKGYAKIDVPFEYRNDSFLVGFFITEFDDLGFDLFSAAFFFLTRLEEYWDTELDQHGRYQHTDSVAYAAGILSKPIVDIWAIGLLNSLNEKFDTKLEKKTSFLQYNTIDVDNAYAHLSKGLIRAAGAIGKNLLKGNIETTREKVKVIATQKKDPYDTYNYLEDFQTKNKLKSIYFFLLGDYGGYDTNVSHQNDRFRRLIKKVSNYADIGIHPSYKSYNKEDQIIKEIKRLEEIIQASVTKSRFHFLRMRLPESYVLLEKVGVTDDYTMGYPAELGFRAGTAHSYTFFNVVSDSKMKLTVHPFSYMDGTLNEYKKLSSNEAIHRLKKVKDEVKNVDGEFCGIWHNDSVSEQLHWKGWRAVYESSFE